MKDEYSGKSLEELKIIFKEIKKNYEESLTKPEDPWPFIAEMSVLADKICEAQGVTTFAGKANSYYFVEVGDFMRKNLYLLP